MSLVKLRPMTKAELERSGEPIEANVWVNRVYLKVHSVQLLPTQLNTGSPTIRRF